MNRSYFSLVNCRRYISWCLFMISPSSGSLSAQQMVLKWTPNRAVS